jgi:glycosyltransferase involved in cell wall biosynthesis
MEGIRFSIIIPVYNAARTIKECLEAVYKQTYNNFEVIIVDDRSKDNSTEIAEKFPCKIIKNPENLGAAKTRNRGSEKADGDILYFIDADTIPKPDVLEKLANIFSKENSPAAVVGAYTPVTPVEDFYSRFQNYYTFFNHEKCQEGKIHWFWTACGAIKKDVFFKLGKFNERYTGASAEDMHMGYDLSISGYEIILDKSIEVTHLHHHTFKSIMRNDLKKSAAWTQLFLEKNRDNKFKHGFTGPRNLISMLSAYVTFFGFLVSLFISHFWFVFILGLLIFVVTNNSFFLFILNSSNGIFVIKGILFHLVVNLIIPFGISLGIINFVLCSFGIRKR